MWGYMPVSASQYEDVGIIAERASETGMRSFLVDWVGTLAAALAFAFAFQSVAFATYHIPSESMVPTLQVGDRLTASKFAYGWSRYSPAFGLELPDAVDGRLMPGDPRRGDVIVFIHPRTGERMIKRLIGLPGDRVSVRDGRITLNGQPVLTRHLRTYRFREYEGRVVLVDEFEETLPGAQPHRMIVRRPRFGSSDMAEVQVPAGQYFMMGDNRDNSSDSRFPLMGFVPADKLVARAEAILYSWYSCATEPGLKCAGRRIGQWLR